MMSMEGMKEELRQRYERLRKREEARRKAMLKYYEPIEKRSNPNGKERQERMDVLDILISVLRDHEKSLDELIKKGSFAMETGTNRLENLLFRLEEAISRLER